MRGSWQEARNRPTAAWVELRRRLALPWMRLGFALHGVSWPQEGLIFGMPRIQKYRGSRIVLGRGVSLRSWPASNPLTPLHPVALATRGPDAVISIGDFSGLTGTTIVAAERVEIGERVQVGANVTIVDTDFHPLAAQERQADMQAGEHRAVVIEDDVFIGMHCLILKGVRVGRGSVIGAGSVVTGEIPPGVIAAGNPARVVRSLAAGEDRALLAGSRHRG